MENVRMGSSFNPQSNHGIMVEEEEVVESLSSSSSSSSSSEVLSLLDFTEDANSHASSPLYEMSSLFQQLPLKRGLSKHYQGKSQSFTSLSNVYCLEDLAKPENPYQKKLKSCKSYGGLSETHKIKPPKTLSKTISKKASRGCCSSLNARRSNSSFGGNRPPIPRHKTSCLSHQTPLFA